ncbi:Uncharacterised protein [Enterobacter cloacae]|nr:Uncharacterised protein [Enterobacter cloacae]
MAAKEKESFAIGIYSDGRATLRRPAVMLLNPAAQRLPQRDAVFQVGLLQGNQ